MILVVHKHNSEKKVTKRHLFRIVRCLNRKPFTLNLTNPAKSPTTGPSSAFSHLNTSPNKGRVNMDFYNWADVVTMSLYSDRGNSLDINHFWFNGWPIKLGLHSRWKNNNSSTVFPWWSATSLGCFGTLHRNSADSIFTARTLGSWVKLSVREDRSSNFTGYRWHVNKGHYMGVRCMFSEVKDDHQAVINLQGLVYDVCHFHAQYVIIDGGLGGQLKVVPLTVSPQAAFLKGLGTFSTTQNKKVHRFTLNLVNLNTVFFLNGDWNFSRNITWWGDVVF